MNRLTPNTFIGIISAASVFWAMLLYFSLSDGPPVLGWIGIVGLLFTWLSVAAIFRFSKTARRWREDVWNRRSRDRGGD